MLKTLIIHDLVSNKSMRLSQLPVSATATIEKIEAERHLARRLMEMGLLPGTSITVSGIAPMGDPIRLSVRGYSLSIRRREAAQILLSDSTPTL